MIGQISKLVKLDSLLTEAKLTRFNSLLPVKIDVLDQLENSRYKLLVGTKKLETKSNMKLDVGESYWGVLKDDKTKGLTLSNLLKQPKLLKNAKFIPKFSPTQLEAILKEDKPKEQMKIALLEHLSKATSKNEFMTTTSMIEALNAGVWTLVLKENQKEAIFQFKKKKSRKKGGKVEQEKLEFYAGFSNLGPVDGVIEIKDDRKVLSLYLYYESSLNLLKNEIESIDLDVRLYKKDKTIEPLWSVLPTLLDVRG